MKNGIERAQKESLFLKGQTPFAIDSNYKRFSQRNTIFSRVVWDETYSYHMRSITEKAPKKVGMRGYSRIGYAAQNASWTVYDKFNFAFNWEGETISKSPTDLSTELPKFVPEDLQKSTRMIKRVAQLYGAISVGITRIDPEQKFIYSQNSHGEDVSLPEGIKYCIVVLVEMDYTGIKTSPTLPASISTGNGYSRMAFVMACLAEFLRNLGYSAIPSGNDTALSVPLAVQAGLGQFGRNGLLITPKFGQRVRICKIFTDMPMKVDNPINFGVTEFCRVCKKCAKSCPSQSIPYETDPSWESPWDICSNNSGGTYKWYVNVETCYEFWVKNSSDCSNCIRVCPFTKPPGFVHDIARFFIKHFRFLDRGWLFLDNMMALFPWWNYGKLADSEKFWNSNWYLDRKLR